MRAFLQKKLDGSFVPACEMSERLARKVTMDELIEIDWPSRKTRSGRWHKRYFKLMQLIMFHCEGIDGVEFTSENVVHFWLKSAAKLYDAELTLPDGSKAYLIKSISYDDMSADEWAEYWKVAIPIVQTRILPTIGIDAIEYEIEKCAGLAA